jgi:Uma2 family endonuclease
MLTLESIAPETPRPLRREEYDELVARGFFDDERLELLEGVIVRMSPQKAPHFYVIQQLTMLLAPRLAGRAVVRVQGPLALSDVSEPEPDVAVVAPGDYHDEHPRTALLVIEVADSSLAKDLRLKARLYAEAAVVEYWVVNLPGEEVVVHREPHDGAYQVVTVAKRGEVLAAAPLEEIVVPVDEILPPAGSVPPPPPTAGG